MLFLRIFPGNLTLNCWNKLPTGTFNSMFPTGDALSSISQKYGVNPPFHVDHWLLEMQTECRKQRLRCQFFKTRMGDLGESEGLFPFCLVSGEATLLTTARHLKLIVQLSGFLHINCYLFLISHSCLSH